MRLRHYVHMQLFGIYRLILFRSRCFLSLVSHSMGYRGAHSNGVFGVEEIFQRCEKLDRQVTQKSTHIVIRNFGY